MSKAGTERQKSGVAVLAAISGLSAENASSNVHISKGDPRIGTMTLDLALLSNPGYELHLNWLGRAVLKLLCRPHLNWLGRTVLRLFCSPHLSF